MNCKCFNIIGTIIIIIVMIRMMITMRMGTRVQWRRCKLQPEATLSLQRRAPTHCTIAAKTPLALHYPQGSTRIAAHDAPTHCTSLLPTTCTPVLMLYKALLTCTTVLPTRCHALLAPNYCHQNAKRYLHPRIPAVQDALLRVSRPTG